MTISAEEKARIARENGKKSRGARSKRGKERSRMNALKDGLRAKTVPLPHEDQESVSRLGTEWTLYVRPTNPAMRHLANDCTRANLLANRCDDYRQSQLEKQAETTTRNWKRRQRARLKRLQKRLSIDPTETLEELTRFAVGVRWMIGCFEDLLENLNERGYLLPEEHELMVRLYGVQPITEQLRLHQPAYELSLYSYGCMPESAEPRRRLEVLLTPKNRPEELRELASEELLPEGPQECREALIEALEVELELTRKDEERVRREHDEPSLRSALREAAILEEPAARRLARSQSEAHRTFHRAWKELKPMVNEPEEEEVQVREGDDEALETETETVAEGPQTEVETSAPNEPSSTDKVAELVRTSIEDITRTSSPITLVPVTPAAAPETVVVPVARKVAQTVPTRPASAADVTPAKAPNEPSPAAQLAALIQSSGESRGRTPGPKPGSAAVQNGEPAREPAPAIPAECSGEPAQPPPQQERENPWLNPDPARLALLLELGERKRAIDAARAEAAERGLSWVEPPRWRL